MSPAIGFLIAAAAAALMVAFGVHNWRQGWRRPERSGAFGPVGEALELLALLRRLETSEPPVVRALSLAGTPSEQLSLANLQRALGSSVQVALEQAGGGSEVNATRLPPPRQA